MDSKTPTRLRKNHIAIVDDDEDIRDLIVAFFKPRGYEVSVFPDAESALKVASKPETHWDVLLTDLKLPRMSGVEFSVQVKRDRPALPVILITTNKSAETAVEAVKQGIYDFIVKPIHFPQLQISVERALHLTRLNGDLIELRERMKSAATAINGSNGKVIGKSPKFLEALHIAKRVAKSRANIFISGESGTGKEVFARLIHAESACSKGPFVAINCSAIPENLLESELFGHAKGSFTGAHEKKLGLFEEAQDGSLFLDEIGDLSPSLQAKLLRVLQERKIKRVGENQLRPINCRILSATHKNLELEVREGRFREDLFFRLNVIPIMLPALRDRQEDLLPLAEMFLKRFAAENDSRARCFSKDAIRYILQNPWRGNVRELENSIERAVVLSTGNEILVRDLSSLVPKFSLLGDYPPDALSGDSFRVNCADGLPKLDEIVRKYMEFAVEKNGGARDKTAKELGIDRKTLYKKLTPSHAEERAR